ncbi:MAG: SGNH/GDSL hydrolase family protein [Candidatus Aureabacteria bacterium]|nr:SGNH/GDSL hydrolase family protein [Candidatus Auribacterota bacterium]
MIKRWSAAVMKGAALEAIIFLVCAVSSSPTAAYDQPPVIPVIDAAMKTRLQAVHAKGQALGNYPDVLSRMGDSITASNLFLTPIGCGDYALAGHTELRSAIAYFGARTDSSWRTSGWCGRVNSFTRMSACAVSGWSAIHALTLPGYCPDRSLTALRCELLLARPAVALIMFGTNDLEHYGADTFRGSLTSIVQECVAGGVIPVLSTIPHRYDSAARAALVIPFNQITIDVATANGVPLWNYWLALEGPGMVNGGISADGIHPNALNGSDSANFGAQGLRYGYNQRNFTALQVLEKVTRVVLLDGQPDPSPTPPVQSLALLMNTTSPPPGSPFAIDVIVQPINQVFNAWAVITGQGGIVYSLTPGRPGALTRGAKPLAKGVQGLRSASTVRLFSLQAIPPGVNGAWTVTAGLVPPTSSPTGIESAIPVYVDQKTLTIGGE